MGRPTALGSALVAPTPDRQRWPCLIADFFAALFADRDGSHQQFRSQLETWQRDLHSACALRGPCLHVPLDVVLRARAFLQRGKTSGADQVCNELLLLLRFEDLQKVALAFERHLSAQDTSELSQPEAWLLLVVHCFPKQSLCDLLEDWRPHCHGLRIAKPA